MTRAELLAGLARLGAIGGVGAVVVLAAAWALGRANDLSFWHALAEALGLAAGVLLLVGAGLWTRTGRFDRARDAQGRRTLVERTPEERRERLRICLAFFGAGIACFVLSLPFA